VRVHDHVRTDTLHMHRIVILKVWWHYVTLFGRSMKI
jgi:hypothetical protein